MGDFSSFGRVAFVVVTMLAALVSVGIAEDGAYDQLTPAELDRLGLEVAASAADVRKPTAARSSGRGLDPPVPVRVVLAVGDTPAGAGGLPVDSINYPVTGAGGAVGFSGDLDDVDDDEFAWIGDAIAWRTSSAGVPSSSIESFFDVKGDGSDFIASVIQTAGSLDSVVTINGLLLAEEDPAPDFPGMFITFASRPLMAANGTAYWISGFSDTQGGSTQARVLYRATDTVTPVIEKVFASGELVAGFTLDSGMDFDYFFSDDGSHHIQTLDTTEPSDSDFFVYLDGAMVMREGDPNGAGENWQSFDVVQVNNAGNYIVSGDTDGATTTDEFIAYNGVIGVREGDTVDGIPLTSTAFVKLASLNDLDQAAYIWENDAALEVLFFAPDAAALDDAVAVLATGDEVDVDDDGIGDAILMDFNTITGAQPFQLAEDGWIYVEVDLDYGGGDVDTVIGVRQPFFIFADGFESGDASAWSNTVP